MDASIPTFAEATAGASPVKSLPFAAIRDLASASGRRRDRLARLPAEEDRPAASGDDYRETAAGLAEDVEGIRRVLDLLGATPNAYVNREALDALQGRVTRAGAMPAGDWAEDLAIRGDDIPRRAAISGRVPRTAARPRWHLLDACPATPFRSVRRGICPGLRSLLPPARVVPCSTWGLAARGPRTSQAISTQVSTEERSHPRKWATSSGDSPPCAGSTVRGRRRCRDAAGSHSIGTEPRGLRLSWIGWSQ